ncbi:MAG TPA: 16S rRNA (cytosine(1402)-N(4))-methyltransferase RsmH [Clostridiaceae bacterium]|nr:16S rRNA (cytosine(1402)-N(4))-methyltransferase RsmH [Clostridiaceae bacterium]
MTLKVSCDFSHIPVLYEETLQGLHIKPDGLYVDCTMGGAGHSAGILERLDEGGMLLAIDQDEDALAAGGARLAACKSRGTYLLIKGNFRNIGELLAVHSITAVDGILADLGVSSHQLDEGERGFSYSQDGPLDMRMDQSGVLTAADLVNLKSAAELTRIFSEYGEERYSRRIAEAIVRRRRKTPFERTGDLSDVIRHAMPAKARRENQHPAKRVFQALRIAVNGELTSLTELLDQVPELLKCGGRLAIISFHSLEDRLVKHRYQKWEDPCECPSGLPCVCGLQPLGHRVGPKRGYTAASAEANVNPRARSARLRVFERTATK